MSKRIEYIIDDIKEQYLEKDNNIPWIIGFSGGKDSTVVLTLVWRALLAIREEQGNNALARQVYVVNNDTLVENPIITDYIVEVMDCIRAAAIEQKLPINVQMENPGSDDPWGQVDLTPEVKIGLTPLPKIKMTPVDIAPAGDFICIFGFRFGRRGIKPKKHEYKVKKHSPVSRIGDGDKKHQQSF